MTKNRDRIEELQEKHHEFILNESVFADDNPSWGEVAEAGQKAELKWSETAEGKELKELLAIEHIPVRAQVWIDRRHLRELEYIQKEGVTHPVFAALYLAELFEEYFSKFDRDLIDDLKILFPKET